MNSTRSRVSTDRNVGIVSWALDWVVYATESLVEEVIEALMYTVSLAHDHCVTLHCGVTNSCNCINLRLVKLILHIRFRRLYLASHGIFYMSGAWDLSCKKLQGPLHSIFRDCI